VVLSEGSAGVRTRAALEGRLVGLRDLSNIRLKHTGGWIPHRNRWTLMKGLGGSVWESNLLFTDNSSAYEEELGLSRKDLASFGTLIAGPIAASFSHPTFLLGRTISTTLLFALRIASGIACV